MIFQRRMLSVPVILFIAALVLVIWGIGVYVTGDYVATLDIAANLVSAGFIVAGLAALVRVIDRLPARFAEARGSVIPVQDGEVARLEPASDILPNPLVHDEPPVEEEPELPRPSRSISEPAPKPEPVKKPTPLAKAASAEPKLVREGVIDGQLYRYYDDGSIHADGAGGGRRYASIDELRAEILGRARQRAEFGGGLAAPVAEPRSSTGLSDLSTRDEAVRIEPEFHNEPDYDLAASRDEDTRGDADASTYPSTEKSPAWKGSFRSLLGRRKEADPKRDENDEPRF
jgi:hypothetical protein